MKQQDYHASITLSATAAQVFHNICNVSDWWAMDLIGTSQRLGDNFMVRFGTTTVNFRIDEMALGKKIVWLVTACHLPWLKDKNEWTGTKVVWEISSTPLGTQLNMTHVGLTPDVECFENCRSGWDFYVKESLQKLITSGHGQPKAPEALVAAS